MGLYLLLGERANKQLNIQYTIKCQVVISAMKTSKSGWGERQGQVGDDGGRRVQRQGPGKVPLRSWHLSRDLGDRPASASVKSTLGRGTMSCSKNELEQDEHEVRTGSQEVVETWWGVWFYLTWWRRLQRFWTGREGWGGWCHLISLLTGCLGLLCGD